MDPQRVVITRSPTANKSIGVGLGVVSGLAMATQGQINGRLGSELHDPMLAAVISFGGGLVVLLAALPFSAKMREGVRNVRAAVRAGNLRPWHCLGGVGGATFVASQSITVSIIGVSLFTVGVVAGQTVSSLFVDRVGLGPAGPQPLSPPRILGALLTLAAVAGSLSGGLDGGSGGLALFALPLVAGVLLAVQQAVNGRVREASGSALTATLINFTSGTAVLAVGWLVSLAVRGGPTGFPQNPVLYLGGLVGILFIALASFVVKWTGVLLLGLAAIAGQLIGATLLDLLFPTAGAHLTLPILIGTAVALAGVAVAALPTHRPTPKSPRLPRRPVSPTA